MKSSCAVISGIVAHLLGQRLRLPTARGSLDVLSHDNTMATLLFSFLCRFEKCVHMLASENAMVDEKARGTPKRVAGRSRIGITTDLPI